MDRISPPEDEGCFVMNTSTSVASEDLRSAGKAGCRSKRKRKEKCAIGPSVNNNFIKVSEKNRRTTNCIAISSDEQ